MSHAADARSLGLYGMNFRRSWNGVSAIRMHWRSILIAHNDPVGKVQAQGLAMTGKAQPSLNTAARVPAAEQRRMASVWTAQ